jgi:hypothetical protein
VVAVQQLTSRHRRDVEADVEHARAAREAALGRHDIESMAVLSARIDQLRAQLVTLPSPRAVGVGSRAAED